ncbi:MAG: hypothetical protein M1817_003784 [Caeruleum heppii]|nr:MAG: hypothetical protein M1817_003784 [Caeruleum heppii]
MPTALILIADGTEEIEFTTAYDVLVRAGFDTKSVGIELQNETYVNCSRSVRIIPDYPNIPSLPTGTPINPTTIGPDEHENLPSASSSHFPPDVLVIPGGAPGAKAICDNDEALGLIGTTRKEGKWVGAICAGTTALVESVRKGKGGEKCKVTSHPSVKDVIVKAGWEYSEERAVVDGKVITSRGPGTAILFALTIVECLAGKAKRDEVGGPMMLADTL